MLDEAKKKHPQWNPAHDVLRSFMKDPYQAGAVTPNDVANSVWATSRDEQKVGCVFHDHLKVYKQAFRLLYHSMFSGFVALSPLGGIIGAYALPRTSTFSQLTRVQAFGTGAAMAGGLGVSLGALEFARVAYYSNDQQPLRFDDDGIQTRLNRLSHNARVGFRNQIVVTFSGITAYMLATGGGPVRMGLSPGTHGVIQALTLGSISGSMFFSVLDVLMA